MDCYYTTLQLSLMLSTSVNKIRTLIQNKKIKAYKVGKSWLISESDVKVNIKMYKKLKIKMYKKCNQLCIGSGTSESIFNLSFKR